MPNRWTCCCQAREFTKPLARAIVEQRRRLALDPRSGASVARFIDNFTQDAERYIEDKVVYLSLRAAYWRLTEAERDTDLTGIYDLLWSVALRIEDGDLSLAERDLRDARKALANALANGAGNEEIAELMQELKEAFNRYMEALAAQMQSGDMPMTSEFPDGDVETVDRQQLQNMLDAIGELAQSGARDQAQAMLEQLESILENMQVPNEQARMTPGEQAMADAIQEMGELITKQRELMDRTFRELERLRRDPESDRNLFMESEEGEGGGGTEEGQEGEGGPALAEDQEDLNDELDRILKQLQDSTEPPDALLEALNAMKTAKDRLVRDRKDLAVGSQGQAIERMQEGWHRPWPTS